ncbi:MAG: hypothetical protein EZS28_007692 [Streblomastix strix]|uniref:Uncharacterized protein n=1 Tax=Streblomastix strix TaxID=222440 RepID=A0A5J4WP80_9EUKA|nr:MAG: hypothetical protein EZS28_007692 [Streblomastix strix]
MKIKKYEENNKTNSIFASFGIPTKNKKNNSMDCQQSINTLEFGQITIQNCLATQNEIEQPQFDTAQPDDAFLAFLARDLCFGAYNQPNTGAYPVMTINADGTANLIYADGRVITESSQITKTGEIFGILCTIRNSFDMRKTEMLQCMLFMRRLLTKGRVLINPWSLKRLLIGCLIVSIKVNRDNVPLNLFVAQALGVRHVSLNEWERSTLQGLEFEVGVSYEEYTQLDYALHAALAQ